MKISICALMGLLMTTTLFASPLTCPQGSQELYRCESTPLLRDSAVAAEFLDHVLICLVGDEALLVVDKDGESEVIAVETIHRSGGVTYSIDLSDHTLFTFSLPMILTANTTNAVAHLDLVIRGSFTGEPIHAHSTYSCK